MDVLQTPKSSHTLSMLRFREKLLLLHLPLYLRFSGVGMLRTRFLVWHKISSLISNFWVAKMHAAVCSSLTKQGGRTTTLLSSLNSLNSLISLTALIKTSARCGSMTRRSLARCLVRRPRYLLAELHPRGI